MLVAKGPDHRQGREERKGSQRVFTEVSLRFLRALREPFGCLGGDKALSQQELVVRPFNFYKTALRGSPDPRPGSGDPGEQEF